MVVVVVVVVVAVVVVVVKVITGGGERHQRTGVRVAASEAGGVDVVADHSFFLLSCAEAFGKRGNGERQR